MSQPDDLDKIRAAIDNLGPNEEPFVNQEQTPFATGGDNAFSASSDNPYRQNQADPYRKSQETPFRSDQDEDQAEDIESAPDPTLPVNPSINDDPFLTAEVDPFAAPPMSEGTPEMNMPPVPPVEAVPGTPEMNMPPATPEMNMPPEIPEMPPVEAVPGTPEMNMPPEMPPLGSIGEAADMSAPSPISPLDNAFSEPGLGAEAQPSLDENQLANPFSGVGPDIATGEAADPFPDGTYLPKDDQDIVSPMPMPDDPLSAVPEINPEGFAPLDGSETDFADVSSAPAQDYVPAYNETFSDQDSILPSVEVNSLEPQDILLAISIVDPASDIEARQEQTLQNIRSDVAFQGKKKKPPKIKTAPLPLDLLVPGTPLIGTIYSPSGGVGKSSTAMNLAVYIAAIAEVMAEQKGKKGDPNVRVPRVLVLDGDIAQGSLALRLKGEVSPSIHTLQLYLDERVASGFEGENAWPSVYENAPPGEKAMRDFVMWNQKVTNLDLLAAPEEPDFFFDFGPGEYRDIIRLLSRFYDVIIIDAGTEIIQESQRAWLQHAHEVFIITAPEIDRMYNASKATRYIARERPHPQDTRENAPKMPALATKEKLSLVTTRADADSGLDIKGGVIPELFPWFEESQKFYIPDVAKEMLRANNSGEFLVLNNPEYAEIIAALAEKLFARYAEMREKRSIEKPLA